jgi:UDP-N-acetyl-D-glucosamine dehydrogenase
MDVAELSKVLENTYRDINIALINEMAQICHAHDINIWDVIEAAASKPFGFQPFYPGPGVGGHCIPKDSKFYSIWAKKAGIAASLSDCARKINDAMPNYIITRLEELLGRDNKAIEGSTILVLGVTYKPDVNDLRESLP